MTKQITITTETNVQVQVSCRGRGRPADTFVFDLASRVVAEHAGKSVAALIAIVQTECAIAKHSASIPTITKYIKQALVANNQPAIDCRAAERKAIVTTINLQTPNIRRAGVTQIKEAAVRLQNSLQKKGVVRATCTIERDLKTKKAGVFVSNPVGRPKKSV